MNCWDTSGGAQAFLKRKVGLVIEIKHKQRVGSHQFTQTIISPQHKRRRRRSNLRRCPFLQAGASISQSSKPFWNLSAPLKVVLPATLDRSILVNPSSLYEVGLEQPLYMSSLRNCTFSSSKNEKHPLIFVQMRQAGCRDAKPWSPSWAYQASHNCRLQVCTQILLIKNHLSASSPTVEEFKVHPLAMSQVVVTWCDQASPHLSIFAAA